MFPYRFFALFWSFLATSQDADCPSKKLWEKEKIRRLNLTPFPGSGLSVLKTKIIKATLLGEEGSTRGVNNFSFQISKLVCWTPTCSFWIGLSSKWGQKAALGKKKELETSSNLRLLQLWEMEVEKASKRQNYL